MKKLLLAIMACAAFGGAAMAQSSGSEGYGYTWKTSGQAGGPTFNWIDISTTGTQITGLADDNFVGPIPIGFNFTYYWLNYNEVYVGSNGYISFGQGFNLASSTFGTSNGFRNLPYGADQMNNMIAPFLADLTYKYDRGPQAGQDVPTAKALYQTIGTKFVISFLNVPYWNDNSANGTAGANTFQIILDNADSSITLQYQAATNDYYPGYTAWLVRGFEDINGQYGATISTGTAPSNNSLPDPQSAVKIDYPATPLVQITDARVAGVFNNTNGAEFINRGSSGYITGIIQNSGATNITTPIQLRAVVQNASGTTVFIDTTRITSLGQGQTVNVTFNRPLPTTLRGGSYIVSIRSFLSDANPSNNLAEAELVVVDTAGSTSPFFTLGYDSRVYPQGVVQGFESQNGGVYIKPPTPVRLMGVQFDMGWVRDNGYHYGDSVTVGTVRVFHDDGPNGTPGTLIAEFTVDSNYAFIGDSVGQLNLNASSMNIGKILRSNLLLANPIIITRGIYIGIYNDRTTRFFWNALLTDEEPPFSMRTYEIPAGTWAPHRSANTFDYALRGLFDKAYVETKLAVSVASALKVSPNPSTSSIRVEGIKGGYVTLINASGQQVKTLRVSAGTAAVISLDGLSKGLYTIKTNAGQTSRFVKE